MNASLRQIDEWRHQMRSVRAPHRRYGAVGRELRERTSIPPSDAVAIGDELWSILNRMPREQAGILERVYLQGGSAAAEGRTRVYRARLAAREVAS